jgi:DNA primase
MRSVEDLLIEKGLYYKSSGSNNSLIRCLSPEHEDVHPSLSVNMSTGQMHCFSCGFSGNIYSHYNIFIDKGDIKLNEFINSMYDLKASNGVNMPPDVLPFIKSFRNVSSETFKHFQAFTTSMFESRVCFPITDAFGNLVAIHTRHLYSNENPKYVTYPPHSKLNFYPPMLDSSYRSIVLVEGIFDLLYLYDNGIKNVVCTFGSSVGKGWFSKIQHYLINIQKVFILYDGDLAGRRGAADIARILEAKYILYENIQLEEGKDPASLERSEILKLKEVFDT